MSEQTAPAGKLLSPAQIKQRFATEDDAQEFMESARWPGGKPHCPKCGGYRCGIKPEKRQAGRWLCMTCNRAFSVLTGTPLQGSKLDFRAWLWLAQHVLKMRERLPVWHIADELSISLVSAGKARKRIRAAREADPGFVERLADFG